MRIYDIWEEGYSATGMEGFTTESRYLGSVKARSFREACEKVPQRKWPLKLHPTKARADGYNIFSLFHNLFSNKERIIINNEPKDNPYNSDNFPDPQLTSNQKIKAKLNKNI